MSSAQTFGDRSYFFLRQTFSQPGMQIAYENEDILPLFSLLFGGGAKEWNITFSKEVLSPLFMTHKIIYVLGGNLHEYILACTCWDIIISLRHKGHNNIEYFFSSAEF